MQYLTYISATKLENCSIENLESRINNFFIQLNDVNITFFKVSVKFFHCAFIETYNPNEYKFEGNTVKVLKKGEILQDGNLYTNETEWVNGSLAPVGILSVCKQPPMDCCGVLVRLAKDEYVLSSNGSLYRNISRELYKPEHSQFINDTIWLCTNFSTNYEERLAKVGSSTNENNVVLVVLTYVGLSFAILSFVLVLVTYGLFEELRTFPGIYLMNLCLAHLLVSLLYLVTGNVETKVACSVIAVLLHYLFLVSFTWMSIIAFETWNVFSKILVQRRNLNSGRNAYIYFVGLHLVGFVPLFLLRCVLHLTSPTWLLFNMVESKAVGETTRMQVCISLFCQLHFPCHLIQYFLH